MPGMSPTDASDPNNPGAAPKYLPKSVRYFQKAIKHRNDVLKREDRERKRIRDQLRARLRREVKQELLANIEEIDSELLSRIEEMREDAGLRWDCGSGERGEALLTLLYDHYTRQGLKVRTERYSIQILSGDLSCDPTHFLQLNIPEEAEYQKAGRERHEEEWRR